LYIVYVMLLSMKPKKDAPPNDNAVVAMKNDIIPALAKLKLSESRLFQYCLAHYDSRGEENPTFEASVDDLKKYFHIDHNSAYDMIRDAIIKLGSQPLEWRENNVRRIRHWFDGVDYFEGEGRFSFRINRDAEPFFLMVKNFFTRYRLGNTKKFKRAASFKLYVNLKQWENTSVWEVDLDELKYRLGVTGKYAHWDNFKRWLMVPAVAEINKHSDLSVGWKPTKTGRSVTGVAFRIKNKTEKSATEAREVHEANQFLKAAKEEEKRLGTTMGSTGIDAGSQKRQVRNQGIGDNNE